MMVKTKKGETAATISHPNSRKAIQLTKQVKKVENRKKAKNFHLMKQNMEGIKCLWFRDHLDPNVTECSREMLAGLIEQYLGRFDEELEQIQLKNSVGQRKNKNRQHASREDIIKLTQLQERQEYIDAGIELPDILNRSQLCTLLTWNGQLRYLQNFKMRRFNKSYLTSKSNISKPPSPVEMRVEIEESDKMEHDENEEMDSEGNKQQTIVTESCAQTSEKISSKKDLSNEEVK